MLVLSFIKYLLTKKIGRVAVNNVELPATQLNRVELLSTSQQFILSAVI